MPNGRADTLGTQSAAVGITAQGVLSAPISAAGDGQMLNERHQGGCFPIRPSGNQPQGFAVSVRLPWGAWDYMAAPALGGNDGSGTLTIAFGTLLVARSDGINDAVTGFRDVYTTLRWNSGVGF